MNVKIKYSIVIILLVVFSETLFRNHAPDSTIRPTNVLDTITIHSRNVFEWIGWIIARITDLYYLIENYLPFKDVRMLVVGMMKMVASPLYVIKGYHNYYAQYLTEFQYYGVSLCVVVMVVAVSCWWFFNECPNTLGYELMCRDFGTKNVKTTFAVIVLCFLTIPFTFILTSSNDGEMFRVW